MSHFDTQFDTNYDTDSLCYADRLEAGFLEFGPCGDEEGYEPVLWENANPFECGVLGGTGDCECSACPFIIINP